MVEEPAAVEEPVVTEEPVASEEPVAVEEPVATEEPVAVEEPVASEEPVAVEEPVASEEPVATEEPVVATEEPAVEDPEVYIEETLTPPVAEEPVVEDTEVYIEDTLPPAANEPAEMPVPKPLNQALTNKSKTPDDEELGVLVAELIDELYPDRRIQIYAYWGDKEVLDFGDSVCLTAKLIGYEGLEYGLRWQYLDKQANIWCDLQGETEEQMNLILNEENVQWLVRVQVDITGIIP